MTRTELEQLLHYSGDYLNRIVNKFTDMCLYDYGLTFCMKKSGALPDGNQRIHQCHRRKAAVLKPHTLLCLI